MNDVFPKYHLYFGLNNQVESWFNDFFVEVFGQVLEEYFDDAINGRIPVYTHAKRDVVQRKRLGNQTSYVVMDYDEDYILYLDSIELYGRFCSYYFDPVVPYEDLAFEYEDRFRTIFDMHRGITALFRFLYKETKAKPHYHRSKRTVSKAEQTYLRNTAGEIPTVAHVYKYKIPFQSFFIPLVKKVNSDEVFMELETWKQRDKRSEPRQGWDVGYEIDTAPGEYY